MRKRRGEKLLVKAAEIFDLPGEAAVGVPRVTITGQRQVHIENHRGLLEYGPGEIAVNTAAMTVKLRGRGLEISAMSDLEMVVTGTIEAIELEA